MNGDDQLKLRLPGGMRNCIAEAARSQNRTMNAEVVMRLQSSFEQSATTSLRDHFAGSAMQALLSSHDSEGWFNEDEADTDAKHCYVIANAMLKARQS